MAQIPRSLNWGHLGLVSVAQFAGMAAATFAQQQVAVDQGNGTTKSYLSNGSGWNQIDGGGLLITDYTSAQLTALADAGGLTPHATYIASDINPPFELRAEDEYTLSAGDSDYSLPWHRRMEACRAFGLGRFTASGLLTRVFGDGSKRAAVDQQMVCNGTDFVAPNGRLDLFRFAGGIPVAAGCAIPYGARIISIQPGVGVTLDKPATRTSTSSGFANGQTLLFGGETVAASYAVTNSSGSAVVTGLTTAQTDKLRKNMKVNGVGVASNATIVSVQSGVGFTMSANSTGAVGTCYIQGIALTCGTTAGSPVLISPGSATLGANTADLAVGMMCVGGQSASVLALDHLIIPIPGGVVAPNSKLRLEYSFAEVFTQGNTVYQSAILNSLIAMRPAGASNQQTTAVFAASHSIDVTMAAAAKRNTKHYMEIQLYNNAGIVNIDAETGSSGARTLLQASAYSGGGIPDFSADQELVLRPYFTGYDPYRCSAQIGEVSLSIQY